MSDNELLLAMSDMMDKKLKVQSEQIKTFELNITNRVDNLTDRVDNLTDRVDNLTDRVDKIDVRMTKMEMTQENYIVPALKDIVSCYMDTHKRYQARTEQMDAMQIDVDVMKKVITEHSVKLDKLVG